MTMQPVEIISGEAAGSFHDCNCHGLHWNHEAFALGVDLDYIVAWLEPEAHQRAYRFLVAPATLYFRDVDELRIDLCWSGALRAQIESLETVRTRRTPNGRQQASVRIEFSEPEGNISLWTTGYEVRLWAPPKEVLVPRL